MTVSSVAFIGLGAMGWHMASHLSKACSDVRVWNRTFDKAEQHAQQFDTQAVTLEQAVQADIIFSCLPTSRQVEQMIAQASPKSGAIWVDCTSGEPDSAKKLAELLKKQNVDYLDAPVSGQTIGAEKGTLTVMVGGDPEALARAYPVIDTFAGCIEHVGASGAGFAVKSINNSLMAVNLWSLSEGMCVLKAQQVDVEAALRCINTSSGQSGISQNIFAQRILSQQFPLTFALNLLAKDAKIATNLAQQNNTVTPILQMTQQLFCAASRSLPIDSDFSASAKVLEQWNHLQLD